jgi:hypothetical protein
MYWKWHMRLVKEGEKKFKKKKKNEKKRGRSRIRNTKNREAHEIKKSKVTVEINKGKKKAWVLDKDNF